MNWPYYLNVIHITSRDGQGSLEYMASYGWALAAILVIGVVLWQMGIFSPSGTPTAGWSGFGSMRPVDWSCNSATGTLSVQWINSAGDRITVTAPAGGCTYGSNTYGGNIAFNVSVQDQFICTLQNARGCAGTKTGDRFESLVSLPWHFSTGGSAHQESGNIWGAAE